MNIFYIARFQEAGKKPQWLQTFKLSGNAILDTCNIMAQKHLDRSEPSYEHFAELRSRVLGGSRRPQLARFTEGRLFRGGEDPTLGLNVDIFYSSNGY